MNTVSSPSSVLISSQLPANVEDKSLLRPESNNLSISSLLATAIISSPTRRLQEKKRPKLHQFTKIKIFSKDHPEFLSKEFETVIKTAINKDKLSFDELQHVILRFKRLEETISSYNKFEETDSSESLPSDYFWEIHKETWKTLFSKKKVVLFSKKDSSNKEIQRFPLEEIAYLNELCQRCLDSSPKNESLISGLQRNSYCISLANLLTKIQSFNDITKSIIDRNIVNINDFCFVAQEFEGLEKSVSLFNSKLDKKHRAAMALAVDYLWKTCKPNLTLLLSKIEKVLEQKEQNLFFERIEGLLPEKLTNLHGFFRKRLAAFPKDNELNKVLRNIGYQIFLVYAQKVTIELSLEQHLCLKEAIFFYHPSPSLKDLISIIEDFNQLQERSTKEYWFKHQTQLTFLLAKESLSYEGVQELSFEQVDLLQQTYYKCLCSVENSSMSPHLQTNVYQICFHYFKSQKELSPDCSLYLKALILLYSTSYWLEDVLDLIQMYENLQSATPHIDIWQNYQLLMQRVFSKKELVMGNLQSIDYSVIDQLSRFHYKALVSAEQSQKGKICSNGYRIFSRYFQEKQQDLSLEQLFDLKKLIFISSPSPSIEDLIDIFQLFSQLQASTFHPEIAKQQIGSLIYLVIKRDLFVDDMPFIDSEKIYQLVVFYLKCVESADLELETLLQMHIKIDKILFVYLERFHNDLNQNELLNLWISFLNCKPLPGLQTCLLISDIFWKLKQSMPEIKLWEIHQTKLVSLFSQPLDIDKDEIKAISYPQFYHFLLLYFKSIEVLIKKNASISQLCLNGYDICQSYLMHHQMKLAKQEVYLIWEKLAFFFSTLDEDRVVFQRGVILNLIFNYFYLKGFQVAGKQLADEADIYEKIQSTFGVNHEWTGDVMLLLEFYARQEHPNIDLISFNIKTFMQLAKMAGQSLNEQRKLEQYLIQETLAALPDSLLGSELTWTFFKSSCTKFISQYENKRLYEVLPEFEEALVQLIENKNLSLMSKLNFLNEVQPYKLKISTQVKITSTILAFVTRSNNFPNPDQQPEPLLLSYNELIAALQLIASWPSYILLDEHSDKSSFHSVQMMIKNILRWPFDYNCFNFYIVKNESTLRKVVNLLISRIEELEKTLADNVLNKMNMNNQLSNELEELKKTAAKGGANLAEMEGMLSQTAVEETLSEMGSLMTKQLEELKKMVVENQSNQAEMEKASDHDDRLLNQIEELEKIVIEQTSIAYLYTHQVESLKKEVIDNWRIKLGEEYFDSKWYNWIIKLAKEAIKLKQNPQSSKEKFTQIQKSKSSFALRRFAMEKSCSYIQLKNQLLVVITELFYKLKSEDYFKKVINHHDVQKLFQPVFQSEARVVENILSLNTFSFPPVLSVVKLNK